MKTSNEFREIISHYLLKPRFIEVLTALGVGPNLEGVEQYLDTYPVKYLAEKKFLKSIESYLANNTLPRYENGLVDSIDMLKIPEMHNFIGLRSSGKYLGQDGKVYIKKQAEGVKGNIFNEEGKYNPTMAQAVFEHLGASVSESIPAFEGFPYYFTISRNFLRPNQKLIQLSSDEFEKFFENMDKNGAPVLANSITHSQILSCIDSFIKERYKGKVPDDIIEKKCYKVRIDYAIQETLKELIYSMDQNLGNTSLIITSMEDGQEEVDISPAYDMDLSFNIGYQLLHLHGDRNNNKFYRTTRNGGTSLKEIVEEFVTMVPGYAERIEKMVDKLNDNYIDKILTKAFNNSGVQYLKTEKARENYAPLIMRRVAELKQAYKDVPQKDKQTIHEQ